MRKQFSIKSLRKYAKKITSKKEFFPSIIIILATIIIIVIGIQFIKESRKVEITKKDAWKTKTGLYIPIELTSFSPKSVTTSGGKITINGHGFTSDTKIYIGSSSNIHQRSFEAKIDSFKENKIIATVPVHPAGKIDIFTIFNGNIINCQNQFEYIGELVKSTTAVQIDSITPSSNSISNSSILKITGSGFSDNNTINLGKGKFENITSVDGKIISLPIPASINTALGIIPTTPGKYDLSVTSNNQESNLATIELLK